jgi:hypothetical protein
MLHHFVTIPSGRGEAGWIDVPRANNLLSGLLHSYCPHHTTKRRKREGKFRGKIGAE